MDAVLVGCCYLFDIFLIVFLFSYILSNSVCFSYRFVFMFQCFLAGAGVLMMKVVVGSGREGCHHGRKTKNKMTSYFIKRSIPLVPMFIFFIKEKNVNITSITFGAFLLPGTKMSLVPCTCS